MQRHKSTLWAVMVCVTCSLISGPRVSAQEDQAALRGTVRDSLGVIPGAEVMLVNDDTKVERTAMTDEVGEYAFSEIVPGTYSVRVSLPGFGLEERKGLRLGMPEVPALDFMLDAGAHSEQMILTSSSCRHLFFGALSTPATMVAAGPVTFPTHVGR